MLKNPYKKDFTLENKGEEDDEDLVDNTCIILDKTSKRALSTLSMTTACAMINFISDDILSADIFAVIASVFDRFKVKASCWGLSD
jgi:hypothetical protein